MPPRAPVEHDIAELIVAAGERVGPGDDASPAELRAHAAELHAWMRGPLEPSIPLVPSRDESIGDVLVRWYGADPTPDSDIIVFVHGGGWLAGDVDSYDPDARRLAALLKTPVVSVEYRRTPEHPFPAAIDDCIAVVRGIAARAHRTLSICGDSAGGNLALGTAVALRHQSPLTAMLLLYPVVDPTAFENRSYTENGADYLLTADDMRTFWNLYAPTDRSRHDPVAAPRFAELEGLPAAVIVSADYDPLRDEARELAARLVMADVPVTYLPHPGLIHGFQQFAPRVPTATIALERAYRAFQEVIARN